MTMQGTQTVRVQTPKGNQIDLNQVKAIRLQDGWHNADDCEVTYQGRSGGQKSVPFNQILGFSELDESQQGGNSSGS